MAYADDVDIVARSMVRAKEVLEQFESTVSEVLRVNESKKKYMTQTRKVASIMLDISMGEHNFELVEQFVYLGTLLSKDGKEKHEIQKRITTAHKVFYVVHPTMRSRKVHRRNKLRIYKILIRSVLLYGYDKFTLTEMQKSIFEGKVLQKILGAVKDGIRYIHELNELFDDPPPSKLVKIRKL